MEKRAQGMSLQQRKDDLPEILRRFEQENMQKVAVEKYRCHFHLMAPVGWLNDPNGLSYFGDRYHVFFSIFSVCSEWRNETVGTLYKQGFSAV